MARGRLSTARRGMLAVAALVMAGLVALPASAFAKTTTRIVAATTTTIANGTAGVNPWPASLKATLQKRISGTHYHSLSGTVALYRYDQNAEKYVKLASKKTSSTGVVTFSVPQDGKYKLYFATTSTMSSSTKYSSFKKTIGETLTAASLPTILPVSGEQGVYMVTMKFSVAWNTEAWAGPVTIYLGAQHYDYDGPTDVFTDGDTVDMYRTLKAPGVIEFNYKMTLADLMTYVYSSTKMYVDRNDYITVSAATGTETDEAVASYMP